MLKLLKSSKQYFLGFLIVTGALGGWTIWMPEKENVMADVALNFDLNEEQILDLQIVQETTLLPSNPSSFETPSEVSRRLRVIVTAYSSSIWETQGDPYITASGAQVRDGIVANNLLPFKTKIRLPEIFGDKIFVVEDRMNSKKGYYHLDVWFSSREEALNFGAKLTIMEILAD